VDRECVRQPTRELDAFVQTTPGRPLFGLLTGAMAITEHDQARPRVATANARECAERDLPILPACPAVKAGGKRDWILRESWSAYPGEQVIRHPVRDHNCWAAVPHETR